MLKTIKTTKQLRLDELIKYVWENHEIFFKEYIKETFFTKDYRSVTFYKVGSFVTNTCIDSDDLFKVEVEEPITEDTKFDNLIEVTKNDDALHYNRTNISDVANRSSKRFYALISGKLELVWEREENGSN